MKNCCCWSVLNVMRTLDAVATRQFELGHAAGSTLIKHDGTLTS
jgi:hypothetical protein